MINKDARAALRQLSVKLIGRRALRPRVGDEEVPVAVAHLPTITPHGQAVAQHRRGRAVADSRSMCDAPSSLISIVR